MHARTPLHPPAKKKQEREKKEEEEEDEEEKKKQKNTAPRRYDHGETTLIHLLRCRFEEKTIRQQSYLSSCAVLGSLRVSTPVSKDTTLAISIPMTFQTLYSSRGR